MNLFRNLFLLTIFSVFSFQSLWSQIKVNEVMLNPNADTSALHHSMFDCITTTNGAEWVEIYNSSRCDTIDLGCYILGGNFGTMNFGAFSFPANTMILPLGFLVVGGPGATGADVNLNVFCGQSAICGSLRWHLPDDYGWIALYTPTGTVSDAVYWTATGGQSAQLTTHPAFSNPACTPPNCPGAQNLKSASAMTLSTEINYAGGAPQPGQTIHRSVDGSGPWTTTSPPSPGSCNGVCADPYDLTIVVDSFDHERCLGQDGYIYVSATGGLSPYLYDWSDQTRQNFLLNLSAGIYSLTVTDANDCRISINQTILNIGQPIDLVFNKDTFRVIKGDTIHILAEVLNSQIASISWSPTDGLSCSNCPNPIANPERTTTYTITIVDSAQCVTTEVLRVEVFTFESSVYIPSAFSPNGDGLNDVFLVHSPKLTAIQVRIFDRWGDEVFVTKELNTGWDGTNKFGRPLNTGVYVYVVDVTFENNKSTTFRGNVTLMR